MIVDELIDIKITKRNKNYYNNLGYNTNNKIIKVHSGDIQHKSEIIIHVICDYCGSVIEKTVAKYHRGHKNGCNKDACEKCKYLKIKEVHLLKYGVDSPMKVQSIRDKMQKSIKEKYGVDNIAFLPSTLTKRKSTLMKRYGVENPMQSDIIKQRHHINQMYHDNVGCIASIPQTQYAKIFGGKINIPIGNYFADILLRDNIIVEFDGSGHDMRVRMGYISKEDFNQKEHVREKYFTERGYKIIRLKTKRDIVYAPDVAINILHTCILRLQYNNIVVYDLDNQVIMPETTE